MSQLPHDKHRAGFAFAAHHCLAAFGRFHGDELQFADPDAGAADGLQDEVQPFVVPTLRRFAKSGVFRFGQFLFFGTVDLLLQLQGFYPQVMPAKKHKQTVHAGQHGINAPHGVMLLQVLLVSNDGFLCDRSFYVLRKCLDIPNVFLNGCYTPFLQNQMLSESGNIFGRNS